MVSFLGSIKIENFHMPKDKTQEIRNALGRVPSLVEKIKKSDADVRFITDRGFIKADAYLNKSHIGLGGDDFRKHQFETTTMFVKRILNKVLSKSK